MKYYLKLKSLPDNPANDCVLNPIHKEKFEKKPKEILPLGLRIKPHLKDANINVGAIDDNPLDTIVPPWTLIRPDINLKLTVFKKETTSSLVYKQAFWEQCEKYKFFLKSFYGWF